MSSNAFIRLFPPFKRSNNKKYSFTVKDNYHINNYPVSCGIAPPVIPNASDTASIVRTLVSSDHQLIGACNLDVGAIGANAKNPYWGDITFQNHPNKSTYGSSGGSALSVFNGSADYSLVTDIGGSARYPAFATNTFGLKFLNKELPSLDGIMLYPTSLDSLGCIARDLETLSAITDLITKPAKNNSTKTQPLSSSDSIVLDIFKDEIEEIHKGLVAIAVSKCQWLPEKISNNEIVALREHAKELNVNDLEKRREALHKRVQEVIQPGAILTHQMTPPDTMRYQILAANLFDWPAVVTPKKQGISYHYSGPVSTKGLLSALIE